MRWMQAVAARMRRKGTEGTLTREAKRRGYKTALTFARAVLRNPEIVHNSILWRRRAQFAVNANK